MYTYLVYLHTYVYSSWSETEGRRERTVPEVTAAVNQSNLGRAKSPHPARREPGAPAPPT